MLTFAPGTTSQSFSVQMILDHMAGPNKTLTVSLSAPQNATIA